MTNHNKLLGYLDSCVGLKTGYTRSAGRTLVSCAQRTGQRLGQRGPGRVLHQGELGLSGLLAQGQLGPGWLSTGDCQAKLVSGTWIFSQRWGTNHSQWKEERKDTQQENPRSRG